MPTLGAQATAADEPSDPALTRLYAVLATPRLRSWLTLTACPNQSLDVQFSVQEVVMKTMSYTESRARYADVLDAVTNDREEVVITRAGHEPVVIVSLADYESLRETAYLMRSPANARRLLDAMERLEAGRGAAHDLIETD
jgi:antitoxin YefM